MCTRRKSRSLLKLTQKTPPHPLKMHGVRSFERRVNGFAMLNLKHDCTSPVQALLSVSFQLWAENEFLGSFFADKGGSIEECRVRRTPASAQHNKFLRWHKPLQHLFQLHKCESNREGLCHLLFWQPALEVSCFQMILYAPCWNIPATALSSKQAFTVSLWDSTIVRRVSINDGMLQLKGYYLPL